MVDSPLLRGSIGIHAVAHTMVTLMSLAFVAGGFAVIAYTPDWKWGVGIVVLFAILPVLNLPQLLRMGRYELTTTQLTWRPFLRGPARTIPLRDISPAGVQFDAQQAAVEIPSLGLRMPYVGNATKLWGGLLLHSALAKDAPAPSGAVTAPHAAAIVGGTFGPRSVRGLAVFAADYVAFLPNSFQPPRKSPAKRIAEAAAGLGLAVVGIVPVRLLPLLPRPLEHVIAALAAGPAGAFDAAIVRIAAVMGGAIAPRADAKITMPDANSVTAWLDGDAFHGKLPAREAAWLKERIAPSGLRV